jgi:aspartyl-tRNA(Asn)/glutamyl-tRNA(Gln) amidotransferase subunit A
VLSAGHYDAYYHTAQKVRAKIKMELDDLYQTYDIIVGPTTPTLPRKIGSHTDDPVAEYLSDMYSVIANLTGMPSLSLPVGRADHDSSRLPVGLQLIGQQWREDLLFGTAHQLERTLDVANFS